MFALQYKVRENTEIYAHIFVALCTTCTTRALDIIDKQFAIECSCTLRSEL